MINYSENYRNLNPLETIYTFERQNAAMRYISAHSPKKILEVGCGINSLRNFGKPNDWKGLEITILEPEASFYEENRAKFESDSSVSIYQETLESFADKYSEYRFDFIVANSVLHEIENLDLFLSQINRILQLEGKVWLNVPNSGSLHRLIYNSNAFEYDYQRVLYGRKHYFGKSTLIDLMKNHGFHLISGGSRILKPMSDSQIVSLLMPSTIGEELLNIWLTYNDSIDDCLGAELDFIFEKFNKN